MAGFANHDLSTPLMPEPRLPCAWGRHGLGTGSDGHADVMRPEGVLSAGHLAPLACLGRGRACGRQGAGGASEASCHRPASTRPHDPPHGGSSRWHGTALHSLQSPPAWAGPVTITHAGKLRLGGEVRARRGWDSEPGPWCKFATSRPSLSLSHYEFLPSPHFLSVSHGPGTWFGCIMGISRS